MIPARTTVRSDGDERRQKAKGKRKKGVPGFRFKVSGSKDEGRLKYKGKRLKC